ncbi:MAG TPA: ADP-forming succinate--CoA ligase subunit beta [Methylophaga aminisulfidivorans]|jgi:succinyl-CoA synthetase beta subunit|uniref:Succinate--CoA ligase [ADP-forming] subunit beta n=1 Tax=Methylophaga thalassica TaxID=40223 RepID=A0ABQ5TTT2_9GAMM|nr:MULTISPECIES: ADP-forming succinate--CoA ligase subunit beta [Methylophaga]WVI86315.1 ADP-forming succinate--CoA ligase subunit beta [Methylophaga thalassica]GLP98568.1 succinate--CoA ligase [ADP-forming] subunit beta [Methylophaga thalassica]HIC46248.1 ADP-forming succinate--CoA ligase subunit beta [Methylophaga sp.]HIM40679.1 ADP-forming succinate--CoA ligase subunit beta [Methylophaga aminisulfidivorans]
MNLHEFQAKQLFNRYGVPTPQGQAVAEAAQARQAAELLAGERWVVKAQVHAGGRGKAGGVKVVSSLDDVESAAAGMLGKNIVTHQTTAEGLPVQQVLVEKPTNISREIYLAVLVDRSSQRIVFMVSAEGGMDIEAVAEQQPEAILNLYVDPVVGLQGYQCRRAAFFLGLTGNSFKQLQSVMQNLYQLFTENDASLVEVNPLVVTDDGDLLAVDAKINLDDNGLFRHADLAEMFDPSQEDDAEVIAREFGLNYISLDGNVACMVNGAGLAMATMDLIQKEGGQPANFLDVGGGTTAARVAEAFKLILSDKKVKSILVNIFGGIVRCDLIAEGIIQAAKEVGLSLPVVVRLEGTNAQRGRELLKNSEMSIYAADDLTDAARQAVAAAQESQA